MEPHWVALLAWVTLGLGFASGLVILADELLPGHGQHMTVMNLVHPITALYLGPVWIWAYFRRGRKSATDVLQRRARRLARMHVVPSAPAATEPWHVGNAVSHCGAGCTLGDIAGEWILFGIFASPKLGVTGTFGWEMITDLVLAWMLGIAFQYLTIVPMRKDLGKLAGLSQAIKVDTLSILSFQVGLFGWMAISHFVLFRTPLPVDTSGHWLMMQIGMILGYATAWPVNRWLVSSGLKEKMDRRKHLGQMVDRLEAA